MAFIYIKLKKIFLIIKMSETKLKKPSTRRTKQKTIMHEPSIADLEALTLSYVPTENTTENPNGTNGLTEDLPVVDAIPKQKKTKTKKVKQEVKVQEVEGPKEVSENIKKPKKQSFWQQALQQYKQQTGKYVLPKKDTDVYAEIKQIELSLRHPSDASDASGMGHRPSEVSS